MPPWNIYWKWQTKRFPNVPN